MVQLGKQLPLSKYIFPVDLLDDVSWQQSELGQGYRCWRVRGQLNPDANGVLPRGDADAHQACSEQKVSQYLYLAQILESLTDQQRYCQFGDAPHSSPTEQRFSREDSRDGCKQQKQQQRKSQRLALELRSLDQNLRQPQQQRSAKGSDCTFGGYGRTKHK